MITKCFRCHKLIDSFVLDREGNSYCDNRCMLGESCFICSKVDWKPNLVFYHYRRYCLRCFKQEIKEGYL